MAMKTIKVSFKQYRINRLVIDACELLTMFMSTRGRTFQLLQNVMPQGWYMTEQIDGYNYFERSFKCSEADIKNVYESLRANKINILQFYPSEKDSTYTVVRLNVGIDKDLRVKILS